MAKAYVGTPAFPGPKEWIKALVPRGTGLRLKRLGKARGLDKSDILREALELWEINERDRQDRSTGEAA